MATDSSLLRGHSRACYRFSPRQLAVVSIHLAASGFIVCIFPSTHLNSLDKGAWVSAASSSLMGVPSLGMLKQGYDRGPPTTRPISCAGILS